MEDGSEAGLHLRPPPGLLAVLALPVHLEDGAGEEARVHGGGPPETPREEDHPLHEELLQPAHGSEGLAHVLREGFQVRRVLTRHEDGPGREAVAESVQARRGLARLRLRSGGGQGVPAVRGGLLRRGPWHASSPSLCFR